MKQNIKISIIIPAYNAEKYIKRTLNSLINQTFSNLEIIVINDGSTDKTSDIVKGISKRDNRIKIIDKENSGVSESRNLGLEICTGDFIGFFDADDYAEPEMYDELIGNILKYEADISICSFYKCTCNNRKADIFPWKDDIKIFEENEIKEKLLPVYIYKLEERNCMYGTVWRMLYSRNIATKVKFNKNIKIAEDLLYILETLQYSKRIVVFNEPLYNYVIYDESSMRKYKNDLDKTNELVHNEFERILAKNNFFEKNLIRYRLNKNVMYTTSISNYMKNDKVDLKEKKRLIKELLVKFNNDKYISKDIVKYLKFDRKILFWAMKCKLVNFILIIFGVKEG